jgi:ABC-type uncharacterized transport system ATPase subunit
VVWERLQAAAANDVALIVHSTDLDEILEWSTRILVVAKGGCFMSGLTARAAKSAR